MFYLAILGRQPDISLAELESLYRGKVTRLNDRAALIEAEVNMDRLGGTIKLARMVTTTDQLDLSSLTSNLADVLSGQLPSGKLSIGLSLYGLSIQPQEVFARSLELKKLLRARGHSVRIISGSDVSAAQILHNHMISRGADIVIVRSPKLTYIGLTTAVQDIQRYGLRDHGRPARSAKVGMLPPKLAQIMINLANPSPGTTILDPFCGTGVILQEALLMGYHAYGSDISPELIGMSQANLDWLTPTFGIHPHYQLETSDATTHTWQAPFDAVVSEGYLGPALDHQPSQSEIKNLKHDAQTLTLSFLANLRRQISVDAPVCLALPAWRDAKSFTTLDILDQITGLGYTLKQFLPPDQTQLIYQRSGQFVGRQLIALRST